MVKVCTYIVYTTSLPENINYNNINTADLRKSKPIVFWRGGRNYTNYSAIKEGEITISPSWMQILSKYY